MKYKVGDKVVINNNNYGGHGFNEGDIVIILEADPHNYLAKLIKPSKESPYKIGDWYILDRNISRKTTPSLNSNIHIL